MLQANLDSLKFKFPDCLAAISLSITQQLIYQDHLYTPQLNPLAQNLVYPIKNNFYDDVLHLGKYRYKESYMDVYSHTAYIFANILFPLFH